jgi:endoglucanase
MSATSLFRGRSFSIVSAGFMITAASIEIICKVGENARFLLRGGQLKNAALRLTTIALATILPVVCLGGANEDSSELQLTPQDALETHGLSVLLFHNAYHPVFGDEKMSGLEIIFHEHRIATNGDVRLSATPAQWDPIPQFKERKRGSAPNELIASLSYSDRALNYQIDVRPESGGLRVAVLLERSVPAALSGKAGFNLEFLPTTFFGKSYLLDDTSGIFPRYPGGPMIPTADGTLEPGALGTGRRIVLSPEDPMTRIGITSDSLIPSDKTGEVLVWHIQLQALPGWTRPPNIGYNQIGYTPLRAKIAVIELDPQAQASSSARILKLAPDGNYKEVFRGEVKPWGKWLRYQYAHFDFSSQREPGVYAIEYAGHTTAPFRIAKDVYDGIWHNTLDTFLAEQMDHVKVREGYRIWHGASHLDDARQAPMNYTHFDGYSQGATTDSPFAPGEHIPGINVGGWYDAGDFDLRTQTHTRVVMDLVLARENFGMDWDGIKVDENSRYVEIRKPDGVPDAIQQIVHGVLYLLTQYKVFGHAIPGVIEPTLQEYTHLGDAASKTDGKIYSEKMSILQSDAYYSGVPDDRWAFTAHTTPLNYDAISALAAASRVLHGFDDKLADECLQTAEKVWEEEHKHAPIIFNSFNTAGGDLSIEEIKAAVELVIATKGKGIYKERLTELLPNVQERFMFLGGTVVRAIPDMNPEYKMAVRSMAVSNKTKLDEHLAKNPYGVPIAMGTWGGSGLVASFATQMYFLHQAFPDVVGTEYTLRGLDYVLGVHPVSNISYVSGIGAHSKLIAYGNNRADYTFIPGGMIPGVTIIQPDFPELMNDWPFLWYENEYVVDTATAFILAANAANVSANEAVETH